MVAPNHQISIIEDDDSLRNALVGLMRSLGHGASSFDSAESFLSSDARSKADCIITDIQMPGLSGIDLIRRLRSGGHLVPVIAITARTEVGLEDAALAGGALCLLRKPFDMDMLVAQLEQALRLADD